MADNKKLGRLTDTAWHIGYVTKDEDDPRRHKSRCIHYTGKNHCNIRCGDCIGSAHCGNHKEKELVHFSDGTFERIKPSGSSIKVRHISDHDEVAIGDCVEVVSVDDNTTYYLALDSKDVNSLSKAAQACLGMQIDQKFSVNGYIYRIKYIKKEFYDV